MRAAKTVCAHEFIMEMENGYDTEVNERAAGCPRDKGSSYPSRVRCLRTRKSLILDEATSSIDTETERMLQKGLNELLKGRNLFYYRASAVDPSKTRIVFCMWIRGIF